jgi:hypothetical protein
MKLFRHTKHQSLICLCVIKNIRCIKEYFVVSAPTILGGAVVIKELNMFTFGALPPPEHEWMVGKTVEEIEAVQKEAELTGKSPAEVAIGNEWKKHLPASN